MDPPLGLHTENIQKAITVTELCWLHLHLLYSTSILSALLLTMFVFSYIFFIDPDWTDNLSIKGMKGVSCCEILLFLQMNRTSMCSSTSYMVSQQHNHRVEMNNNRKSYTKTKDRS